MSELIIECPSCDAEVRIDAGYKPPPPGPRDYSGLLAHTDCCSQSELPVPERYYTVTVTS